MPRPSAIHDRAIAAAWTKAKVHQRWGKGCRINELRFRVSSYFPAQN
jgi:hypothetical protein